jgi:protease IV
MTNPDPLPLAAPPRAAPPAARISGGWGEAWRLLTALTIGFALPVLSCFGLVLVTALACRIMAVPSAAPASPALGSGRGPAVAVIRVEGAITSGRASPFATTLTATSDSIVEQVRRAQEDGSVRAVLLIVNSPGGGVNASDVIYHALQGLDKPLVVLMGDIAASGGYYISMASDHIVAHPNTLTGSIGVISEFPNAEALLENIGVEFVVITSGPRKDFGSPYREMTEEERAYWQAIVDETYADFVRIVAEGRGMTAAEVAALADGRVFTGRQALELGLVDALGYEADAIAAAAELGGIEGEPRIIEMRPAPTFFDFLSYSLGPRPGLPSLAEIMTLIGHPTLSARWLGP